MKSEGNELYKAGKIQEAVTIWSQAIDLEPRGPETAALYANRSLGHDLQKQYKEALEDADRCIEMKPDWFKVSVRMCLYVFESLSFASVYYYYILS